MEPTKNRINWSVFDGWVVSIVVVGVVFHFAVKNLLKRVSYNKKNDSWKTNVSKKNFKIFAPVIFRFL